MFDKIIIAVVVLIVVLGAGYWAYQNFIVNPPLVEDGEPAIPTEPVFSREEAIKKLFAEKYDIEVSAVTITISQDAGDHVRGGVEIQPGGPENSGMFLAAKVDDHWELAFDGQGAISCEQVANYNFPEDMVADCSSTQTIETGVGEEFTILLDSNPSTGYQWEVTFEEGYLTLVEKDFQPSPHPEGMVGVGGQEIFKFSAVKSGQTKISFSYLRSWEQGLPPIETRIYQIIIR